MNSVGESAIAHSAHALTAAVDALADASLIPLSDTEFTELMRELETSYNKLEALKHRCAAETEIRSLADHAGVRNTATFLVHTLRLGRAEAWSRIRTAEVVCNRMSLAGMPKDPVLAHVAEAERDGDISADHVRRIQQIMKRIPAKYGDEDRETAELILTDYAREVSPDALPGLGEELLSRMDPDGAFTVARDRQRMRGITRGHERSDGMTALVGEMTPELTALLTPVLAKFARPGMCNPEDPESPFDADATREEIDAAAARDTRTAAQRNHDALLAFLNPDKGGPTRLGSHRGLPVSAIVTMSLEDLERQAGVATTATGGTLSIPEAIELAANATLFLAVFDTKSSKPLYLGRANNARLASPAQRLALIASDKGCTRPGCDAPASMSAVHHITEWAKGGTTDIDNLTLACDACHALVNDGPNGWKTMVMGADSDFPGRTGWIPPPHIDPTGTPRVNHRHHPGEVLPGARARVRARVHGEHQQRDRWFHAVTARRRARRDAEHGNGPVPS